MQNPAKRPKDALCINQENLDERAAQVQMMHFIYAYATAVIVWLGEEADGSSEALQMLGHISRTKNWDEKFRDLAEGLQVGVRILLSRPWFDRIWVCIRLLMSSSSLV